MGRCGRRIFSFTFVFLSEFLSNLGALAFLIWGSFGILSFETFYWGQIYHIGYHYIILPDGTLESGRPEKCKGAHAVGYNDYLGICLIGDFSPGDNINGEK